MSNNIIQQEEIALWTAVEGNCSLHDGNGAIGHRLIMIMAKGSTICERTCYACITHLLSKKEKEKVHL